MLTQVSEYATFHLTINTTVRRYGFPGHPTLFVNIHEGAFDLEAFTEVHTCRHEAAQAAEDFHESYKFTLTDIGKIDLRTEFSEAYQARLADGLEIDRQVDELRDLKSFTMHARP